MQFAIAVFTIGAVLILIGLVGGDLSYRGLTVPKVGVLPRFTTTITGGVFLTLSVAIFFIAEFGHEVAPGPQAHAAVVDSGAGGSDPTSNSRVDLVSVQFNDHLTEGALEEQIEVTVDNGYIGALHAEVSAPSDAIEFHVEEGFHSYSMRGIVLGQDGVEYPVGGDGTFAASAGASFDLLVSSSGALGLSPRS